MNGILDSLPHSVNHELNTRKVHINYATEKLRDVVLASHRNDTLNRGVSKEKVLRSVGEERRGEVRRGEERLLVDTLRNGKKKRNSTETYTRGNTTAEWRGKSQEEEIILNVCPCWITNRTVY